MTRFYQSIYRVYPEWDLPGLSPAIKVAEYQTKLRDIDEQLMNKRKEAKKRRLQLDAQWRDLEEKEETFKCNFLRFNKFVRENEEKRDRAERKIKHDAEKCTKKDSDIKELQDKYDEMMEMKELMESQIKEHKMYEEYLYNVVEESAEFKDVDDILARYEALIDARKQLIERQEKDLIALENAHTNLVGSIKLRFYPT